MLKISNGNTTIWNGTSRNTFGQFTGYTQGQYATTVSFNAFGELSQVTTSGVRNMKYVFDDFNNLSSREDLLSNQKEIFSYDNLNRLSDIEYYSNNVHIPAADKTIYYDNLGNITGKTGIAVRDSIVYGEKGFGPHALTSIRYPDTYSPLNQAISYTDFNKTETITDTLPDGSFRKLQITYGYDHQRRKSVFTEGPATTTKYFFDAWGNARSAADWRNASTVPLFACRGFTGHEHLEAFALINMNGRMYDPVLGRFLSTDNYVQMPDFSQNFNRYSYCLNNPLIYTDPSGEVFGVDDAIIILAMAYFGGMHNYYNILQMNYGNGLFSTTLNKTAYTQAGLKIFSERWAYGAQWARYGINGGRINYVDRMWRSIITTPVTADEYRMLMFSF